MKPVYQTRRNGANGNCFEACVASILELSLDQVVDLASAHEHGDWLQTFMDWCTIHGLYYVETSPVKFKTQQAGKRKDGETAFGDCYHIITGISPRGNYKHAVVGRNGKTVHDPFGPDAEPMMERCSFGFIVLSHPSRKLQDEEAQ